MTPPISLDLERDYPFQRRSWLVQRVGWCVMLVFLVAGAVGVFAKGPLGRAHQSSSDGSLSLSYDRLARYQAPTELKIDVARFSADAELQISLDHDYLKNVAVEQILPEPISVSQQGDMLVYRFSATGETPLAVCFRLKNESVGPLRGSVTAGEESLEFHQFVYP